MKGQIVPTTTGNVTVNNLLVELTRLEDPDITKVAVCWPIKGGNPLAWEGNSCIVRQPKWSL